MNELNLRDPIYFTEELRILRDQIRRFIADKVVPVADAWEEAGKVPRDILVQMGDLGFLGIRHDSAHGGSELDALASAVLAEELGRGGYGGFSATVLVHTDMASPHLARYGNEEQKRKYLPDIIAGRKITAIAVTEPSGGSDVAGLKTRAVRDGDDYVLNGSKMFITNGVYGDIYFVAARTDTEVKPSRGVSMFIVEKGTPGFHVSRPLDKHGWRCSDTAELTFDDCRIPAANLLGEENKGFYAIMNNFQNERMVLSALSVGEAWLALELTVAYLKDREAFGGALWDKQALRHRLAMHVAEMEAGRQLIYHAAWLDSQGFDCIREVSQCKVFCAEMENRVMYDCLQFHGGAGYLRDSTIERLARDARINPIGGGTTETMLDEIAKRL